MRRLTPYLLLFCFFLPARAGLIPCSDTLPTPNPENDFICWDPQSPVFQDTDLTGFAIWHAPELSSLWSQVGTTDEFTNWWKSDPMLEGYYCVQSIDTFGLQSPCATVLYWAPCAQWNVDIDMTASPCVAEDCQRCIAWDDCPEPPADPTTQCCTETEPIPDCTPVACPPPIGPADWPTTPCDDPGEENP